MIDFQVRIDYWNAKRSLFVCDISSTYEDVLFHEICKYLSILTGIKHILFFFFRSHVQLDSYYFFMSPLLLSSSFFFHHHSFDFFWNVVDVERYWMCPDVYLVLTYVRNTIELLQRASWRHCSFFNEMQMRCKWDATEIHPTFFKILGDSFCNVPDLVTKIDGTLGRVLIMQLCKWVTPSAVVKDTDSDSNFDAVTRRHKMWKLD